MCNLKLILFEEAVFKQVSMTCSICLSKIVLTSEIWFFWSYLNAIVKNLNCDFSLGRIRTGQHDCSICLSEIVLAVETNCGHVFCGECMFTYYSMANTGTRSSVQDFAFFIGCSFYTYKVNKMFTVYSKKSHFEQPSVNLIKFKIIVKVRYSVFNNNNNNFVVGILQVLWAHPPVRTVERESRSCFPTSQNRKEIRQNLSSSRRDLVFKIKSRLTTAVSQVRLRVWSIIFVKA